MVETPGDLKKKGASNAGKAFSHLALAGFAGWLGLGRLRGRLGEVTFLVFRESSGLGTQAAGGVLWVGAAGAEVGVLGLSCAEVGGWPCPASASLVASTTR